MRWTTPTDDQYDERRALFNGMIDGRPRLIATCESPADVVAALSRATSDDLEIAVRSGGHADAGTSTVDNQNIRPAG
jgi:FAD/FMN-containing dehydrogenase